MITIVRHGHGNNHALCTILYRSSISYSIGALSVTTTTTETRNKIIFFSIDMMRVSCPIHCCKVSASDTGLYMFYFRKHSGAVWAHTNQYTVFGLETLPPLVRFIFYFNSYTAQRRRRRRVEIGSNYISFGCYSKFRFHDYYRVSNSNRIFVL